MRIELGSSGDLEAFIELLEELGAWLWARGVQQWEHGSNRAQLPVLGRYLVSGDLILAREGPRLAGGCIVSTAAVPEWASRPGQAAYLHKLAVARFAAGRDLGGEILERAAGWASDRGLPTLRLDCWDGNTALRSYYRARGFVEHEAVHSHGYLVRLLERALAPQPPGRTPS